MARLLPCALLLAALLWPGWCSAQDEAQLIRSLEQASTLDQLTPLYRTAAQRGDRRLAGVLISRLVDLESKKNKSAADRAHIVALLQALGSAKYRDLAPTVIMSDLRSRVPLDWVIRNGEVIQRAKTQMHIMQRKRLRIAVLGNLEHGLQGRVGNLVFELGLQQPELREAIEQAWRKRPERAVAALVPIVTSGSADPTARARGESAAHTLKTLGGDVMPALLTHLRQSGLSEQARELRQSWKSGSSARKLVAHALELLAGLEDDKAIRMSQKQIDQARVHFEEQQPEQALKIVREVLGRQPDLTAARELYPKVLLAVGRTRRREGKRGQAVLLFEEALRLLKGNRNHKAATPLARMLIEASAEDLEAIVIRGHPHPASDQVAVAEPGETFDGVERREWVMVSLPGERTGYLPKPSLTLTSSRKWSAKDSTPFFLIKERLDRAKDLSPSLELEANKVYGRLAAREAKRLEEAGDEKAAKEFWELAEKHDGLDDRKTATETAAQEENTPDVSSGGGGCGQSCALSEGGTPGSGVWLGLVLLALVVLRRRT